MGKKKSRQILNKECARMETCCAKSNNLKSTPIGWKSLLMVILMISGLRQHEVLLLKPTPTSSHKRSPKARKFLTLSTKDHFLVITA